MFCGLYCELPTHWLQTDKIVLEHLGAGHTTFLAAHCKPSINLGKVIISINMNINPLYEYGLWPICWQLD